MKTGKMLIEFANELLLTEYREETGTSMCNYRSFIECMSWCLQDNEVQQVTKPMGVTQSGISLTELV